MTHMTWDKWQQLSKAERLANTDNSDLTPQLAMLEGCRVEVVDNYGEKRRFNVGKSTGWKPIHLEVYNRRSTGGHPAAKSYKSVVLIRGLTK